MQAPSRFDLPKGHVEPGESELQCALRELWEETSVDSSDVKLDDQFRYQEVYYPRYVRYGGRKVEKTLVIFVGFLRRDVPIVADEHPGFHWVPWVPPHRIQARTIDPLLNAVEARYGARGPTALRERA